MSLLGDISYLMRNLYGIPSWRFIRLAIERNRDHRYKHTKEDYQCMYEAYMAERLEADYELERFNPNPLMKNIPKQDFVGKEYKLPIVFNA